MSPVIDFYPDTFPTDLNGKKQEWEAVTLIPFIEEVRMPTIEAFFNNQQNKLVFLKLCLSISELKKIAALLLK